jgi:hypothetical protein
MKLSKIISGIFILSLLISPLFFGGCKKVKNPTEGVKLIIDYNLIQTTFSIRFVDASTGELIGRDGNKQVEVKIEGQHAVSVIDISGLQKDLYKSTHGFVELALDPGVEPSADNPVKFTVVASTEGYLKTSLPVEVLKNDNNIFEIRMVNLDNPPQGVSKVISDEGESDPEGRVKEDLNVVTPGGEVDLKIKSGTILKNSNGEPLTGQLNISLFHFSNLEDESLMAFPGGLNANVEMPGGEYEQVFFFSAGFIALEIADENGKIAETVLNYPLEITMEIPEETYNSDKQAGVAAGDTLPVWSYEVETGISMVISRG